MVTFILEGAREIIKFVEERRPNENAVPTNKLLNLNPTSRPHLIKNQEDLNKLIVSTYTMTKKILLAISELIPTSL